MKVHARYLSEGYIRIQKVEESEFGKPEFTYYTAEPLVGGNALDWARRVVEARESGTDLEGIVWEPSFHCGGKPFIVASMNEEGDVDIPHLGVIKASALSWSSREGHTHKVGDEHGILYVMPGKGGEA